MKAYGIQGAGIKVLMDQMTQSVILGRMEFGQFATSLGGIIPVAAQAGVGMQQLGAAYAVLTNVGNSAAESSTVLRNIIQSLVAPTLQQRQAADLLGIGQENLRIRGGDLAGTLDMIAKRLENGIPALKGISDTTIMSAGSFNRLTERMGNTNEALRALFGGNETAMRGFFALTAQGGAEFSAALTKMGTSAQGAAQALRAALQDPQVQLNMLKSSAETLAITIGSALLPAFMSIVQAITPILQALSSWTNLHPALTEAILGSVAALGALSLAIKGVSGILYPLQYMLGGIGNVMWILQEATGAERTAMEGQAGAAETLEVAQARLLIAQQQLVAAEFEASRATTAYGEAVGVVTIAERERTVAQAEETVATLAQDGATSSLIVKLGLWEAALIRGTATAVASAAAAAAAWASTALSAVWSGLGVAAATLTAEEGGISIAAVASAGTSAAAWVASSAAQVASFVATQAGLIALRVEQLAYGAASVATAVMTSEFTAALAAGDVALAARLALTGAWAVAQGVAAVATGVLTGAVGLLDAALLANPIGLVIITVAALGAGIYLLVTHFDQVREAALNLWDALSTKLDAIIILVTSHGDDIKGMLLGLLSPIGSVIGAVVSLTDRFSGLLVVLQKVGDFLGMLGGKLHDFYDATAGAAGQNLDNVKKQQDDVAANAQANAEHVREQWQRSYDTLGIHSRTTAQQQIADAKAVEDATKHAAEVVKGLQAGAQITMQAYAVGIMEGSDKLQLLRQAADQAAAGGVRFAQALSIAQQNVAEDTGQWGQALKIQAQRLSTDVDNATGHLASALAGHGANIERLTQVAAAAVVAQQQFTDRQTEAGVRIALASGVATQGLSQFSATIQQRATGAVDLLTAAYMRHEGNIEQLTAQVVRTQGRLEQYDQAHARAQLVVDQVTAKEVAHAVATGQATDAVSRFTQGLQSKATSSLDLLAVAIMHHAGNIGELASQARSDEEKLASYGEAHRKAEAMVGATTSALKDLQTQLADAASTTFRALVDAAFKGQTGLDNLTTAAAAAAERQQHYADVTSTQTEKIDLATGKWADALQIQQKRLEDSVANAQARLAMDRPGSPQATIDTARLEAANQALDSFKTRVKEAQDAGHAVAQSFSQVAQAASDRASRALDAYAQGLLDHAPQRELEALRQTAIRTAQDSQNLSTLRKGAEDTVTAAIHVTAQTWASFESQIRDRASKALDSYSLSLATGKGNIDQLRQSAISTAEAQQNTADIRTIAETQVASAIARTATSFDTFRAALETKANTALSDYTILLVRGNNSSRDMNAAWERVVQTSHDLTQAQQTAAGVQADIARHSSDVAVRQQQETQDRQDRVNRATAQYVSDVENHTGNVKADAAALREAQQAVLNHAKIQQDAGKIVASVGQTFDQMRQQADTLAKQALSDLARAIFNHAGNIDKLAATAVQRAQDDQRYADAENQAALIVAQGLQTAAGSALSFSATMDSINKGIAAVMENIETMILHGTQNALVPSSAAAAAQRRAEGAGPEPTQLQEAIGQLVPLYKAQYEAQQAQTQALLQAAIAEGDFVTQVKIARDKIDTDWNQAVARLTADITNLGVVTDETRAALAQAADEQERSLLQQRQIDAETARAQIDAAKRAGDASTAFEKLSQLDTSGLAQSFSGLEGYFRTGTGSLSDLLSAYQTNRAEVERDAQATIAADLATGQFADALSKMMAGPQRDYNDALARTTIDILQHGQASQADIDATVQARVGLQAFTDAQWDATYATASAADQSRMLSQRFSEVVSRSNALDQMQGGLDQGNLAVIAANSALQVAEIKVQTTALEAMAGVLSAQQNVSKALSDGQIAAVNDQTKILSDTWSLQEATSPAALRVAQDQLRIDQVVQQQHAAAARWQERIAVDQVAIAREKGTADMTAAQGAARLASDHLKTSQDQLSLTIASNKLQLDQLTVLNDIDSNLGAVQDYGDLIRSDLQAISQARSAVSGDQLQEAVDSAAVNAAAAAAAQVQAQLNLTLVQDQGGAAQADQQYNFQLAWLNQQLTIDQHLAKIADNTGATASGVGTLTQAMQAQADYYQAREDLLVQALKLATTGGARDPGGVGSGDFTGFLSSWASGALAHRSVPR